MVVCLGSIAVVRFELCRVCALASWMIGANVQCKLFVALQLEVVHHFIERWADGRSSGDETPVTFRATKTPKPLLLNPDQLPAHGLLFRCAPSLSDCTKPFTRSGRSGKCVRGRAKFKCANFGWSVGRPTYMEGFCCAHTDFRSCGE